MLADCKVILAIDGVVLVGGGLNRLMVLRDGQLVDFSNLYRRQRAERGRFDDGRDFACRHRVTLHQIQFVMVASELVLEVATCRWRHHRGSSKKRALFVTYTLCTMNGNSSIFHFAQETPFTR